MNPSATKLLMGLLFSTAYRVGVFCLSRTLSFKDVLEFSTYRKDKLNVESKAFNA